MIGGVVMTVWATIFEQCITLTTRNLCLLILISFVKDCISASTLDRRETLCLSDSWVAAAAIVACTTITPPSPSFECLSPKVYMFLQVKLQGLGCMWLPDFQCLQDVRRLLNPCSMLVFGDSNLCTLSRRPLYQEVMWEFVKIDVRKV